MQVFVELRFFQEKLQHQKWIWKEIASSNSEFWSFQQKFISKISWDERVSIQNQTFCPKSDFYLVFQVRFWLNYYNYCHRENQLVVQKRSKRYCSLDERLEAVTLQHSCQDGRNRFVITPGRLSTVPIRTLWSITYSRSRVFLKVSHSENERKRSFSKIPSLFYNHWMSKTEKGKAKGKSWHLHKQNLTDIGCGTLQSWHSSELAMRVHESVFKTCVP